MYNIPESILNNIDEGIYITDKKYSLIYANKAAREKFGLDDKAGMPCYKAIYGKDAPCEKCIAFNDLGERSTVIDNYIDSKNIWALRFKAFDMNGTKTRLCAVRDVTRFRSSFDDLKKQSEINGILVECIQMLNEYDNADEAINKMLSVIADYHKAERSYIFEFDSDTTLIHNTYEWCREGITPQIDLLRDVDISVIDRWIPRFMSQGEFFITSVTGGEVDKSSEEYRLLELQGIDSLMAAPIFYKGQLCGFLGVDNPTEHTDTLILLRSAAAFIFNDIQKRKNTARLYELSFRDTLTGTKNRYAYVEEMTRLEKRPNTSVGIVFADINGLKRTNDLHGHEQGDKLIKSIADKLKNIFGDNVFRVGGDEFVVFIKDISKEDFDRLSAQLESGWTADSSASAGYLWTDRSRGVEELVANADRLMYETKKEYYKKNADQRSRRMSV